jgi:hypothetical protein
MHGCTNPGSKLHLCSCSPSSPQWYTMSWYTRTIDKLSTAIMPRAWLILMMMSLPIIGLHLWAAWRHILKWGIPVWPGGTTRSAKGMITPTFQAGPIVVWSMLIIYLLPVGVRLRFQSHYVGWVSIVIKASTTSQMALRSTRNYHMFRGVWSVIIDHPR